MYIVNAMVRTTLRCSVLNLNRTDTKELRGTMDEKFHCSDENVRN